MRTASDAVAEVFLRPDNIAFNVNGGLHRAAPQLVSIFDLEPLAEIKWLVPRRKHGGAGDRRANGCDTPALDLAEDSVDGVNVSTSIDAVSQILLSPHDGPFHVDRTALQRSPKLVSILRLEEIGAEVKRLVSGWECDV
jgi:hypothetical protein